MTTQPSTPAAASGSAAASTSSAPAAAPATTSAPAAAASPPAAAAKETPAAAASTASEKVNSDAIDDILSFGQKPAADAAAPVQKQDDAPAGGDGAVDGQPPAAAPVVDPEKTLLTKQLKEATDALEAAKKAPPAAAQPGAAAPEGAAAAEPVDETPPYLFNFPPQLHELLNSENPQDRATGLTTLTSGVARGVHKVVMTEVQKRLDGMIPKVMEHLENVYKSRTEITNIAQDFYGRYADFDKPELRPVVTQTAMALAKEMNVAQYSPEFGDAVAARVRAILSVGQPAPVVPAKTPAMLNGSGARGTPSAADALSADIMATLS